MPRPAEVPQESHRQTRKWSGWRDSNPRPLDPQSIREAGHMRMDADSIDVFCARPRRIGRHFWRDSHSFAHDNETYPNTSQSIPTAPMVSPGHNHPPCQDASFLRSCSLAHAAYLGNRRVIHLTTNSAPTTLTMRTRICSTVTPFHAHLVGHRFRLRQIWSTCRVGHTPAFQPGREPPCSRRFVRFVRLLLLRQSQASG
jgi:hypothetical protein